MYGIPISDINNMPLEEIELFIEYESLWQEQKNIAFANMIGKVLGVKK